MIVDAHAQDRAEDMESWATGRLLSSAARLVEHDWNQHLATWDLNHASLGVLHVLLRGPMTQRELALAVQVEDQTMSRIVERLERSGYLERHRDGTDRRRLVVSVTEMGRATCGRATDLNRAEEYFSAVEDLPTLRAGLLAIIRSRSEHRWGDVV